MTEPTIWTAGQDVRVLDERAARHLVHQHRAST
ncbi:MAG: hypothetical protein AVDCRST_MAG48-1251 [uncultured Friedmanniella sp.]|uniref:Uncharacterized protein n=1 Tax=uncultured Friedmanniella sp. TaxID=335381 RepID=A0A6J4K9P8_9ACTN|nr:MAG: hypothetical protein AVDCRST_MAG48-1251 [uncultured Friedmanniella sp.]